jgi:hypothetical protein
MAMPIVRSSIQIEYPSSDGLPLAESDFQLNPWIYAVDALRAYIRDCPNVYVARNMFITLVVYSEVLGLELRLEGKILRFYDPRMGRRLLSYEESE